MSSPSNLINPYSVLAAAYADLGQRGRPDAQDLARRSRSIWIYRRNALIDKWTAEADRTCIDLAALYDIALEEVARYDLDYAHGLWASDLDTADEAVAAAVAVITWYRAVYAGRVPDEFPLSLGEVAHWLDNHNVPPPKDGQLSLFLGLT